MTLPTTYSAVLLLSFLTMVCWGCWLGTRKLDSNWRFELYCVDFAIGLLAITTLLAFTLGETGDGLSFRDNLLVTGRRQLAFAFVSGGVFCLGNLFLVAAASVAGMAVAYPVAGALAIVVGVIWSMVLGTQASVGMLAAGAIVLLVGIVLNARGFTYFAKIKDAAIARDWKSKHRRPPKTGLKAIWLGTAAGILLGCCYPLAGVSKETELGLRPYAVAFLFAAGVLCATPVLVLLFMNVPVEGKPLPVTAYLKGRLLQHAHGLAGGAVFGVGLTAFLAATAVLGEGRIIDAAGIGIIEAAILVAALFGLILGKEFRDVPRAGTQTIYLSLAVLAVGIGLVAAGAL